jgi:transcriptional regulator with XRE-family HTH domain
MVGVAEMSFSEKLQQLREQSGLSQAGLAEKSGLSLRSIQNWEQGHRNPSAKVILALARALDVPAETFLLELTRKNRAPKRPRGRPRKGK